MPSEVIPGTANFQGFAQDADRKYLEREIRRFHEGDEHEKALDAALAEEGARSREQKDISIRGYLGNIGPEEQARRKEALDARSREPIPLLQEAKDRELGRAFSDKLPVFQKLFGGVEQFDAAYAEANRQQLYFPFADSVGAETDRRMIANMMFYEAATGRKLPDDRNWDMERSYYARARLGWKAGKDEIIDEGTFYQLAGGLIGKEMQDRTKRDEMYRAGRLSALNGKRYQEAHAYLEGMTGARAGDFEPAHKSGFAEVHARYRKEELRAIRPLYETFAEALNLTGVADVHPGDARDAFGIYSRADQESRLRILSGLAVLAEEDKQDVTGFMNRIVNAWKDGNLSLYDGLSAADMRSNVKGIDWLIEKNVMPADVPEGRVPGPEDTVGWWKTDWGDHVSRMAALRRDGGFDRNGIRVQAERPMTPAEREQLLGQRGLLDGIGKFVADAEASGIRIKRDLDTGKHDGLRDTLGDGVVMMSGSVPEMAVASAAGGAMLPVLFVSRYERRLAQLRAENPELGEERLTGTAFASALTDTGLERLEVLIAGGKLPAVRGALGKLGGGAAKMEGRLAALTGRAAAVGQSTLRGGIRGSAATGTELLQNVAPEGWKSLAAALQEDIKGADWDTVIAREEAALGDTALVSFGFVAVFGVGRRAVNYIDEGSLRMLLTDPHAVGLTGLSPVDVKRVIETAQHDSAAAADLAKQAADTTPVAERRERLLIVQEQMMQEQQQVQTQLTQQRQMQQTDQEDPGQETRVDSVLDDSLPESGPSQGTKQVIAANGYRYLVDHLERPVRLNMDVVNKKRNAIKGCNRERGRRPLVQR
ncbi:hypothetical protein [Luteolibacter sp. Populi]|uniref:hypothetical protein n=1 Tax=Luteolibacter sp. Populi TaxID=3230487 RepID=UPI0034673B6D